MKTLLLCVLLLSALVGQSATTNLSNNLLATVQGACDAAANGDVIQFAVGTNYWQDFLKLTNKMVTLQGVNSNATVIVDENPTRTASATLLRHAFTNQSGLFRVTGIGWRGGVTNSGDAEVAIFSIETPSHNWRVDRNHFDGVHGRPAFIYNGGPGLWDNNRHDWGTGEGFYIRVLKPGQGAAQWSADAGNSIWSTNVNWGSTNVGVVFENNIFYGPSQHFVTDGDSGAAYLFRYNYVTNGVIGNHEMGNEYRGPRGYAAYRNTINFNFAGNVFVYRGGTGLIYSNTLSGSGQNLIRLFYYRATDSFPSWEQANGTNSYDTNNPTLFFEGTHDGATANDRFMIDSTSTWTPNELVGYSVINLATGKSGMIQTNSATRIWSLTAVATNLYQPLWNTGDGYRIYKVIQSLDQAGVGAGDLMAPSGTGMTNSVLGGKTYPRHSYEPIYYWGNTGLETISYNDYGMNVPGLNFTNIARPGYTELIYPHPLATAIDGGDSGPTRGKSLERGRGRIR